MSSVQAHRRTGRHPFRLAPLSLAFFAIVSCGGSGSGNVDPPFQAPVSFGLSADLVPVTGSLFFNNGVRPPGGSQSSESIRKWLILDPDGTAVGTWPGEDGRYLSPYGKWKTDGEVLVVSRLDGTESRHEWSWRSESEGKLVARSSVDVAFFVRDWHGASSLALRELPAPFVKALPAASLECSPVSIAYNTLSLGWRGSLKLGDNGRYSGDMTMVRACADDAEPRSFESGHLLQRLRGGSWKIIESGRRMQFHEDSGAIWTARLDWVGTNAVAGWPMLCIDGAVVTGGVAAGPVNSLIKARSPAPNSANLPLVLEEFAGCRPIGYASVDPTEPDPMTLELGIDGKASASGLGSSLRPIRSWRMGTRGIELAGENGVTVATLSQRWDSFIPQDYGLWEKTPFVAERRIPDTSALLGKWSVTSAQFPARLSFWTGWQWIGEIEFSSDGRFRSELEGNEYLHGMVSTQVLPRLKHPLSNPLSGQWVLDSQRGEITFTSDSGSAFALRTSWEGTSLQIDSLQFSRR